MKIRSKPLYDYLSKKGVLCASEEEILLAKLQYRKEYKKQWKKDRVRYKEIRIELPLRTFKEVQIKAHQSDLKHTTYVRSIIVSSIEQKHFIVHRELLLELLQIISISAISALKNTAPLWEIAEQLESAEKMLLNYLNADL